MQDKFDIFRDFVLNDKRWKCNWYRNGNKGYYMNNGNTYALKYVTKYLKDCNQGTVCEMLLNWEYRMTFDSSLKDVELLEIKDDHTFVVQTIIKFLLCDPRQFVFECSYVQREYEGSNEWIVLMNDNDTEKYMNLEGHIRGKVHDHGFIVRVEDGKTVIYFVEQKDYLGYLNNATSLNYNKQQIQEVCARIKKSFENFEEWKGEHDFSPFNSLIK